MQPNLEHIRRAFALGAMPAPGKRKDPKWSGLIATYAESFRYGNGVARAWQECSAHLVDASASFASTSLTPRERRARTLIAWLNEGRDARKIAFFCDEEGKPRPPGKDGKEAWEWFFEDLTKERGREELDEWEKSRKERVRL
ncbi:hypothetical protein JCM10213v2_006082 [Rhodosporidiobolus nylandii]